MSFVRPLRRLDQASATQMCLRHLAFRTATAGGQRANFANTDISGLSFASYDLTDADFTAARCQDTNFSTAILDGTAFFGADLRRANLRGASLKRADMRGCSVRGADLTGADMAEADLREGVIASTDEKGDLRTLTHQAMASEATSANMVGTNLQRAKMGAIIALQADFSDALMRGCRLIRAHLKNARMEGADLEGADLSGANLEGANLRNAILTGATTWMMKTHGADMTGVITEKPAAAELKSLPLPVPELLARHARWVASLGKEGQAAVLDGADIRELQTLAGRDLCGIPARGAVFQGMDLTRVQFAGAQLEGADFRFAKLAGVDFRGANLRGARFNSADLTNARFCPLILVGNRRHPADLRSAVFRFARCAGADFRDVVADQADFSGADFSGAKTTGARFELSDMTDARGYTPPPPLALKVVDAA